MSMILFPDEYELIQQPDILIVEGINTLQLPANQQIYVSDFLISLSTLMQILN